MSAPRDRATWGGQRSGKTEVLRQAEWGTLQAAAPTIPPETCPVVDSLSARLDAVAGDLDQFRANLDALRRKTVGREDVVELLLDASQCLAGARLRLEELRSANSQLRESGRYWYVAARKLAGVAK